MGSRAHALRAPALRMKEEKLQWYWQTPGVNTREDFDGSVKPTSILDTTGKFDELAAGAAADGSAALKLGREPGTCDPYDPKSAEYCMVDYDDEPENAGMMRTAKLGVLFFLWYFLNTAYNIGNKLVLTAFPMPWTAATWELFFGFPYVFLLWSSGLRKTPKLSLESIKLLAPSGVLLAMTHVGGVISFGLGAISFTHVLKATEPVWSALISAAVFRDFMPVPVYLSLVPIILGVSLASLKELSFSWMSFVAGTGSAVTSAAKAILSKKVLDGKPLGENLTPANMFAVLSILGFLAIAPVSLILEPPKAAMAAWAAAFRKRLHQLPADATPLRLGLPLLHLQRGRLPRARRGRARHPRGHQHGEARRHHPRVDRRLQDDHHHAARSARLGYHHPGALLYALAKQKYK